MTQVLGDEACIAELLPQPGRGRVTERVRRDPLLEARALSGAVDDCGERRLLKAAAGEPAEDGCVETWTPLGPQSPELGREPGPEGLAARLASLPATNEQRGRLGVELGVARRPRRAPSDVGRW